MLPAFVSVKAACEAAKVNFLLTVVHPDDVKNVRALTSYVKVGSGEAHQAKLAEAIKTANFERVLVSNGVRPPHQIYREIGAKTLACISRYPHPSALVPARLTETFAAGWSAHCVGLDGCMTAVALGAKIIEKHVCLKGQARPMMLWEANVEEMMLLQRWISQHPDRFLGRWNHAR